MDTRIALDSGTPGDECLKIPRFAAGRHGRRVGGQCSSAMGASIGTRMGWSGSASQSKAWVDAGSREVRFSRCGLHLLSSKIHASDETVMRAVDVRDGLIGDLVGRADRWERSGLGALRW